VTLTQSVPTTPPGRYERRLSRRPLLFGALVVGLAITFVFASQFHPLVTGPSERPGWRSYQNPEYGWRLQFPASWHAQRIAEKHSTDLYKPASYGILISNLDRRIDRPPGYGSPGVGLFAFDMRGFPEDIVAIQAAWTYGGGFGVRSCTDTPLPLSLKNAQVAPMPWDGATKHVFLPFEGAGEAYFGIHAWFGPTVSGEDMVLVDQIVSSISLSGVDSRAAPC